MTDADGLRASDDDREQLVRELHRHFAEGRLDDDELSARVDAAYRARTQAELGVLRADLPRLPAQPHDARTDLARRRAGLQRQLVQQAGGSLGAFVICVVIWAATGASGSFWPVWVLLAVVIPLVRNGWRLYGPAPELDRVEAELEARRRRERRLR